MATLYEVLGVQRDATPDDIKKAYRREALKKHPDRGGNKEEFQAMQTAYDVLSDPEKRAEYDQTGQIPADGAGVQGPSMPDLSSLFGSVFSGGGGIPFPAFFGPNSGPSIRPARGPNKVHEIGVTLGDLYHGKTLTVKMKRDVLCSTCTGKGGEKMSACTSCNGRGFRMRRQQMGPIVAMMHEPCEPCQQTGQIVSETCKTCRGRRTVESESTLDVVIRPGMQAGDRIVFAGQCSESPMFETPGDVILVVRAASTDTEEWIRRGQELSCQVELSLAESMLGWERHFDTHPSGKPLHLAWTGGPVRDGEVLRVVGWGMPGSDLHVVCRVAGSQGTWSEDELRALKVIWPDWKEPTVAETTERPTRS